MRNKNEPGFFDEQFRLEKLTDQNDPLVKLAKEINWEQFRNILTSAFEKGEKGVGGRPPYDYVMMFKIMVLQRYYNLSDGQTQYQILDRLSFMRFLGIAYSDSVPDEKTIWLFREKLTRQKLVDKLFDKFLGSLEKANLVGKEGRMVDASFVESPRQRNSREENQQIKDGIVPEEWEDSPNKLAQKDLDARWAKKNDQTFYGYKDHVKVDVKSKLIIGYEVTDASVHDSQPLEDLLSKKDKGQPLYGDSAYTGEEQERVISKMGMINQVNEKGYRNKPLTKKQLKSNRKKSKFRARVEHVFGFMEISMKKMYIHSIGKIRAEGVIGLMNLTYNLIRSIQIRSLRGISVSI
jgi:transposase, IS5 family